ncbi:hypothetical protein RQP46_002765 [Phenoliferia psychrophenolica]
MPSKFNPLVGKKVAILGGSSGLGYGAAEISLDHDAIVFIGSSSAAKVEAAAAKLRAAYPSGTVHGRAVNMKEEASVAAWIEWVAATGNKGIDHLIYSAGDPLSLGPLGQVETEKLGDTFDVRVFGIFRAVKAAQPHLNVGGSVCLTTGSAAFKPSKGWTAVTAVTGAIVSLTKALAVELAPLRVNVLAPGMVVTELWDSIPAEPRAALFESGKAGHLTGTVGHPDDVAQGYLFAMTSRFLTGQCIKIEGGAGLV